MSKFIRMIDGNTTQETHFTHKPSHICKISQNLHKISLNLRLKKNSLMKDDKDTNM